MKNAVKSKSKSKDVLLAEARREIKELKSQMIHTYHFASLDLSKANMDAMLGSGVILELTALGGKKLIDPVMIKNGLSKETILAIQRDLRRSFEYSIEFQPPVIDD